jgi:hypothetical protein
VSEVTNAYETTAPSWPSEGNDRLRKWQWHGAKWIKPRRTRSGPSARYFLARHEFDLTVQGMMAAEVHVAADSDFRLYCNGRLVGQGQPRCTTVRVPYRSYDVTSYLREGRNCLAVAVYANRATLANGLSSCLVGLAASSRTWPQPAARVPRWPAARRRARQPRRVLGRMSCASHHLACQGFRIGRHHCQRPLVSPPHRPAAAWQRPHCDLPRAGMFAIDSFYHLRHSRNNPSCCLGCQFCRPIPQ